MNKAQPNFFIVGAPKAGTTSLYHYLLQHPEIYMSPVKETNHFASEIRLENFAGEHQDSVREDMQAMQEFLSGPMVEPRGGAVGLEWEDYLKLFRSADGSKAIGEASVAYLWSESAARNIRTKVPGARIIMILRNPADRAFSQYKQQLTRGTVRDSFFETCRQAAGDMGGKFRAFRPFLELGLYAEQVRRYLDLFPRENIHIAFYEDYCKDAQAMVACMLRFLDVNADFPLDLSERHRAGSKQCSMEGSDRRFLTDFYRDDVRKLGQLLNRDLSHWER